jgi:hypothetical protein
MPQVEPEGRRCGRFRPSAHSTEDGQRRGEVRSDVDSAKLATLIASTLEGGGMVSRLRRNREPLDLACRHLEEYLETKVRARKSKAGADRS